MRRNPKHLLPQMRLHAGSGHARVRINGTEHWLGRFGSPEALAAYDRLVAQYLATRGVRATPVAEVPPVLAIHQEPEPLQVAEEPSHTAPCIIALNFEIVAIGDDTIRATEPGLPKLPTIPEIYPTYPPGYSGVSAGNVATPFLTLAPYPSWSPLSPIGPVGSYWDLGNIAVLGMTQSDLNTRFLTDPESTPLNYGTSLYGKFVFSYQTSPGAFSVTTGDVVAIPEPSTLAIAAAEAGVGGVGLIGRRRKKAASTARRARFLN